MRSVMSCLLVLAALLAANTAAAQSTREAGKSLPPQGRMIVLDMSQSMWAPLDEKKPEGKRRYEVANDFVARLARTLTQGRPSPEAEALQLDVDDRPTGMVVLGHQHAARLGRCDDYRLVVPPIASMSGRLSSEIDKTLVGIKPNGQTPLLDAAKLAFEKLPEGGGALVIVSDLDEDYCERDPCDLRKLVDEAQASRPIRVRFLVAVGLRPDRTKLMERLQQCLGSELLHLRSPDDVTTIVARIAGTIVAEERALDETRRAALAPKTRRVRFAARLAQPLSPGFEGFDLGALGLALEIDAGAPLRLSTTGDGAPAAEADVAIGRHRVVLRHGDTRLGEPTEIEVRAEGDGTFMLPVAPARLTLRIVPDAPDRSTALPDNVVEEWILQPFSDQAGTSRPVGDARRFRFAGRPEIELVLPPGRYSPTLRVDGVDWPAQRAEPVFLGQAETRKLEIKVNVVELRAVVVAPSLFAGDSAPGSFALRRNGSGRDVTLAGDDGRLRLFAGIYKIERRALGTAMPLGEIEVRNPGSARVEVTLNPTRVVFTARDQEGGFRDSADIVWRVRRVGAVPGEVTLRGSVFDQTLPPGRYQIDVEDAELRGSASITVERGGVVSQSITMR